MRIHDKHETVSQRLTRQIPLASPRMPFCPALAYSYAEKYHANLKKSTQFVCAVKNRIDMIFRVVKIVFVAGYALIAGNKILAISHPLSSMTDKRWVIMPSDKLRIVSSSRGVMSIVFNAAL
jgi:hypothetical protein